MAALAFKAIDYGAEKIPDKLFEKIPGGFFTPAENKKIRKKRADDRRRSEQRHSDRGRRRSHRDRTPPTDYSDHSGYDDTDYEKEYRTKQRRRAKSLGRSRSYSRSASRGRYRERSRTGDLDGEMDRAERGPEFLPPPSQEYRPYNPADYAPTAAAAGAAAAAAVANPYYDPYDHRGLSSSARPDYAYPSQPQPQPLGSPQPVSSSAARYTPAGANIHHPATAPLPSQNSAYPHYNPSDYAPPNPSHIAAAEYHPSPPPFYRQQSRSQPSLPQYPYPDNQHQMQHLAPPSRHGSTSSSHHRRHGDRKHHRTRSAGNHGRSGSRVTDQLRDRFDNLDMREKNLAASVGGALAGGIAGNAVGKGTLSTLIGAAIGGLGGRELEKRHDMKRTTRDTSQASQPSREKSRSRHDNGRRDYSRSPSRERRKSDRYHSDSESDSGGHHQASRRRRRSSRRHDSDDD